METAYIILLCIVIGYYLYQFVMFVFTLKPVNLKQAKWVFIIMAILLFAVLILNGTIFQTHTDKWS